MRDDAMAFITRAYSMLMMFDFSKRMFEYNIMKTISNNSKALLKFQNRHVRIKDRDQCKVGNQFNINRPLPNLSQQRLFKKQKLVTKKACFNITIGNTTQTFQKRVHFHHTLLPL